MRDSVVRNLGATTPSLRQEAEDRRKRVKLGLWSLLGTCSLIALVKVLSLMASDLCGLLIELTSSPKSTVKMLPISRDGEDMADETQRDSSGVPFSSEKVRDPPHCSALRISLSLPAASEIHNRTVPDTIGAQ